MIKRATLKDRLFNKDLYVVDSPELHLINENVKLLHANESLRKELAKANEKIESLEELNNDLKIELARYENSLNDILNKFKK